MSEIVAIELHGSDSNGLWDHRWSTHDPKCPAVVEYIIVPGTKPKVWSGGFPDSPPAHVLADRYNPTYRVQYADYWACWEPHHVANVYRLREVVHGVAMYDYVETRG